MFTMCHSFILYRDVPKETAPLVCYSVRFSLLLLSLLSLLLFTKLTFFHSSYLSCGWITIIKFWSILKDVVTIYQRLFVVSLWHVFVTKISSTFIWCVSIIWNATLAQNNYVLMYTDSVNWITCDVFFFSACFHTHLHIYIFSWNDVWIYCSHKCCALLSPLWTYRSTNALYTICCNR